jgi:hypothetical protein
MACTLQGLSPQIKAVQFYAPKDKPFVALEERYNFGDPFSNVWKGKDTGMVPMAPGESRHGVSGCNFSRLCFSAAPGSVLAAYIPEKVLFENIVFGINFGTLRVPILSFDCAQIFQNQLLQTQLRCRNPWGEVRLPLSSGYRGSPI